ncbi:MAG: DUF1501 domain-containing protein, partial [Planctomycetales bacterium]|nr:DUF1501 domain-containing protein [Planctomycetales bacterium]
MGSIYSRVAGANDERTGMPTNVVLFPRAVDPDRQAGNMSFGKFNDVGSLGSAYTPFVPGAGGTLQQDMQLNVPPQRLDDRRSLLAGLDRIKRAADSEGLLEGVDRFQEQAFSTILGGVADAFDLSRENPATLARYDTAPLVRPDQISRKWNNYNNYV